MPRTVGITIELGVTTAEMLLALPIEHYALMEDFKPEQEAELIELMQTAWNIMNRDVEPSQARLMPMPVVYVISTYEELGPEVITNISKAGCCFVRRDEWPKVFDELGRFSF